MRILLGLFFLIIVIVGTIAALAFCLDHFPDWTVIPVVIVSLVGIMFSVFISTTISCPNCSHWVDGGNAYCEDCGYEINPECEICHNTITSGEYCNKCGEKVNLRVDFFVILWYNIYRNKNGKEKDMSKCYDEYGEFVCPNCGASLGYGEFLGFDWVGDDYVHQSECYCEDCKTKFVFSEKYEFNPDRTTCAEVDY